MDGEKTFEVGGTSIKNGVRTWRFANGKPEARAKVLNADNHTEVNLIALPTPMTRDAAIAYLKERGFDAAEPTRGVGGGARTPKEPKAPKAPREPKGLKMTKEDHQARPGILVELEQEGTPEVEEAARVCHKASWLKFMPWDDLSPASRAEYRLEAMKALAAKKAEAPQDETPAEEAA